MIENNYFCSIFLMLAQSFESIFRESMMRTLEVWNSIISKIQWNLRTRYMHSHA